MSTGLIIYLLGCPVGYYVIRRIERQQLGKDVSRTWTSIIVSVILSWLAVAAFVIATVADKMDDLKPPKWM